MKSAMVKPKPRRYTQGARAEATEATAKRIVNAFLARLMRQWFDEITLDRVASEAGVTVQTVVRRFGGKEGLLAEAIKVLAAQINAQRTAPGAGLERLVENLIADYEQTGDAILRLLALEPRHPALGPFLETGRRYHRAWVEEGFGAELGNLSNGGRERALDALVVVTDVYTWKLLRRDMGRSVGAAAAAMRRLVRAVLAEFSGSHSEGDGH